MLRMGVTRLAGRELRARLGPSLSLGVAVLIGVTGFTVLTSAADTQRLETVGTVQSSSRQSFDILVRPRDSRLPVEVSDGLVQPGYLTGLSGITLAQWHKIVDLPDVELAAPISIVGFVTPHIAVPVDMTEYASSSRLSAFRVDAQWDLPDGSRLSGNPHFVVSTPQAVGGTGHIKIGATCGPTPGPLPPGSTATTAPSESSAGTARASREYRATTFRPGSLFRSRSWSQPSTNCRVAPAAARGGGQ